jgi:hypothetical protein
MHSSFRSPKTEIQCFGSGRFSIAAQRGSERNNFPLHKRNRNAVEIRIDAKVLTHATPAVLAISLHSAATSTTSVVGLTFFLRFYHVGIRLLHMHPEPNAYPCSWFLRSHYNPGFRFGPTLLHLVSQVSIELGNLESGSMAASTAHPMTNCCTWNSADVPSGHCRCKAKLSAGTEPLARAVCSVYLSLPYLAPSALVLHSHISYP